MMVDSPPPQRLRRPVQLPIPVQPPTPAQRLAAVKRQRRLRDNISPDRAQAIRDENAAQHQQQRHQLSPDRVQSIRDQDAAQHRQHYYRQQGIVAQQLHTEYLALMNFNRDANPPVFGDVDEHSCGSFDRICRYCGAKHFLEEQVRGKRNVFTSCCRQGRLQLPPLIHQYPRWLRTALTDDTDINYANFRAHSRSYNASLSFVSLGAHIKRPTGRGPPCFIINGMAHHYMHAVNDPNNDRPGYAQLYYYESGTQANELRMQHPAMAALDATFVRQIHNYITSTINGQPVNQYAKIFRSTHELLEGYTAAEVDQVRLVFNLEYQMPGVHPGRQNAPVAENEVAAVFVLENDGVPNIRRDFEVYARRPENQPRDRAFVNITSPHLDPMCYVILFPHGDPGWNIHWNCLSYDPERPNEPNKRFSMQQYKCALLQVRDDPWRPILHAGNLTQQFIVDSYLQIESNNLDWVKMNQDTIQAQAYTALNDFVKRQAARMPAPDELPVQAAPSIILPSTFTGSSRYMRQLCLDAMAIFGRFGKPDLFMTVTCNPTWSEITANLLPGERPHDRPDIVSRVFTLKLESIMDDIKRGRLGPMVCYVYTIEFQKRGLPHAHILINLQTGFKPISPAMIDKIVCAELPNRDQNPRLFDIVSRVMIHQCRADCKDRNGGCKKHFPKKTANVTELEFNNYPIYRRRQMPAKIRVMRANQPIMIDNTMVVPYNPYFTLKYNAHINIEICTNMHSAIKYIYDYVFKGFDVASLSFTRDGRLICNEVKNYINCRYVSAPEAIWRIFEFKMHDNSHAVYRLPIHLEQPREIFFEDGMGELPEREDERFKTMLNAFFELNEPNNSTSRGYLYTEIPTHFVYDSARRLWKRRQQRGDSIVARIRDCSTVGELFALRMLLLHVPGPQSFAHLRNVNGRQHATFRAAAQSLGLMKNDEIFYDTFDNLLPLRMPPQLRQLLASLLMNYIITSAETFWERYRQHMIEDFRRMPLYANATEAELFNFALHDLNRRFAQKGLNNRTFGLPRPQGDPPVMPVRQRQQQQHQNIVLNQAQQHGFDRIMGAARRKHNQRLFVVIGPGGSGKTTLYKRIINTCRAEGLTARVFATTGIAATLMEGGTTVHRGFGLPLDMHEQAHSTFRHREQIQCLELSAAHVILIDEVTMMVKDGLRIVDEVLRFIMGTVVPFGGKTIVLGGDFRQLLPVIPGGTRTHIVSHCVISSPLWRHFEVISLTENMRAIGDQHYVEWLLKLGTGSLDEVAELDNIPNMIEIPKEILLDVPAPPPGPRRVSPEEMPDELRTMIQAIFGDDINDLTSVELASRAILASTVKTVMAVNNHLIASLDGQLKEYLSIDEVASDYPHDVQNYPVEYLNAQQPSGLPPHKLKLKIGAVVMLLRNLDPENGLSNGTRLRVTQMLDNAIEASIISESHYGDVIFIARMDITSSDSRQQVQIRRLQFPLIPAFAMTINKSQGQTIERCGIYLNDLVFAHGQLYVALSRSRNRQSIKVFVKEQEGRQGHLLRQLQQHQDRVFTMNVVFREVFVNGEIPQPPALPNLEDEDPELANALIHHIDDEDMDEFMGNMDQRLLRRSQPVVVHPNPDDDYGDYPGNIDFSQDSDANYEFFDEEWDEDYAATLQERQLTQAREREVRRSGQPSLIELEDSDEEEPLLSGRNALQVLHAEHAQLIEQRAREHQQYQQQQ